MKVGTDGVLLGAWVDSAGAERILDIGTGTGLIALMLAQRSPSAQITAIEPNVEAAADAAANFAKSAFAERVQLENIDLQSFQPKYRFDLIVCNPPFFMNHLPTDDSGRNMARHAQSLTPEVLFSAAKLLSDRGIIAGIYPTAVMPEVLKCATQAGLYLRKETYVKPTPHKAAHRVLFAFGKNKNDASSTLKDELIIESNGRHGYSEDFKNLLSAYYLNF